MAKRQRQRPNPAPQPDVRRIIQEELQKALALPAGTQTTQYSMAYLQSLQNFKRPAVNSSLVRDPLDSSNFGPGSALIPAALDPAIGRTGRPAPRLREYPVSTNLQTTDTRKVPWTILRDAADQVSIMRSCIEVVKSTLTGLEWSFGIDATRARHLARKDGASPSTVEADLTDKFADTTERLHDFWLRPDRINQWTFSEWLGAVLEDQLVLDAVSIYPHMTLKGDLHSLEILDSTTIKPLIDYRGATPQPPYPAYQQVLWGFPRGEMIQSQNPDAEFVSAVYGKPDSRDSNSDALIYKIRNRRSRSPYGFSAVEQALTDVDLWLKRYDWLRSEYTAGVTPEMIVKVDATMTPEQLKHYEAVFNDTLSGDSRERHRARFLPQGFEPDFPHQMDSKFSSDFDLHIIRLICAAFDVLPTSLGFTPNHGMGGMGGQSHQEGEKDTQLYRATKPSAMWITDLINEICRTYLDMPGEVTFRFHGLDPEDDQKEADLLKAYVQSGLQTLNEGRDQRRMARYSFPEADQPMVVTPTGPVWLNVAQQPTVTPGNLPGQENQVALSPSNGSDPADVPGNRAQKPQTETNQARTAGGVSAGKSATYRRRVRSEK